MSPIQAAHLRMISTLPVRTHEQRVVETKQGGIRSTEQTRALHAAIKKLRGQGYAIKAIGPKLGVARSTVEKHLNGNIRVYP